MLSEHERLQALKAAKELVSALEKPQIIDSQRIKARKTAHDVELALEKTEDAIFKFAYTPTTWMAIRIFVELKVFPMLSEQPVSAQDVSKRTKASELLLNRLFRVLVASGFVEETDKGVYGPNKWTRHLSQRTTEGMVRFIYDIGLKSIANTPDYLQQTGYRNPKDGQDGLFQAAFDCKGEGIFNWLERPENSVQWDAANSFFEGDRGSRASWVTWFPVQENLIDGSRLDSPLLVDVAGGRGHDLIEFHDRFPDVGTLVLQDQQSVLDDAVSLPVSIEKRKFDFFKEPPLKGARIYFLKFILHDWPDQDCLTILRNVSAAMTKDYSYLVINEFILPDEDCPVISAQWDLMMMVLMSGMERAEGQWRRLLKDANLQLKGFYQPPGDGQGIIIATV